MEETYDFAALEPKWQKVWQKNKLFQWDPEGETRMYCLTMFPYPSGVLHMGHVLNYTIGDSVVRYHIAQKKNVLTPMGWDSFGLPAENAAIKAGTPPAIYTTGNILKMRSQMLRAGWGYDWSLELATSYPGYYRWTQWLFLQFYQNGLAYKKMAPVNWCINCKTVLANEQVHEGKCERCGTDIEQKDLEQWFFRMSAYAQRLLDGHQKLKGHWPEHVLKMQEDWIGRSEGTRLDFTVESTGDILPVFTTRPDTVYGVTFMSLAPEHPLLEKLLKNDRSEAIRNAAKRMRNQSAIERASEGTEKEGVFTGHYCVNPFNKERVALWVANYALMDYGTGAVMGVPAHDQRDFMFAKKYRIPIKVVIQPQDQVLDPATMEKAYLEDGVQVNSGPFDKMPNRQAMAAITQYARDRAFGDFTLNYRLKDWLLSRQRYWGAPIPIIYCARCGVLPVPETDLPVLLPENIEFLPTGDSPLKRCESWRNVKCHKCGGNAEREADTMDTFVDSSWYFLRYPSPRNEERAFDPGLIGKWIPVDLYIGGAEHARMHLIFARFFTMVLKDLGLIEVEEPFKRLFCQGIVYRTAYRCPEHLWVAEEDVKFTCEKCGDVSGSQTSLTPGNKVVCQNCGGNVRAVHKQCSGEVTSELSKMSKTKKNGIGPDDLFQRYGADTVRLGILSMGPVDQHVEYSGSAMVGEHRFLHRLYKAITALTDALADVKRFEPGTGEPDNAGKALRRKSHQTLAEARQVFEQTFSFNTLIARDHELLQAIAEAGTVPPEIKREAVEILLFTIAPVAPHIAEELWKKLGNRRSIFRSAWPAIDPEALKIEDVEIAVQINGKIKARVRIPAGMEKEKMEQEVLGLPSVQSILDGRKPKKVFGVPDRLVNIIL